jgi:hypothetical protein
MTARKPTPAKKRTDKRGTPKGKGTLKGGRGGRIGNPPFEATDEQRSEVISLVAAGAQHWIVARAIGISEDTLKRHFTVELDHGKQLVDAKVGGAIARKALDGDSDMQKFYAARRAGWKSTTAVEQSGPDGRPIQHEVGEIHDFSNLTRDEKRQLEELLAKAAAKNEPA